MRRRGLSIGAIVGVAALGLSLSITANAAGNVIIGFTATGDSTTSATLHAIYPCGYWHDEAMWPWELYEMLKPRDWASETL